MQCRCVWLAVAVLAACKSTQPTKTPVPDVSVECGPAGAARNRVFTQEGILRTWTLSADVYLVSLCGNQQERDRITMALWRKEKGQGTVGVDSKQLTLAELRTQTPEVDIAVLRQAVAMCGGVETCAVDVLRKQQLGVEGQGGGGGGLNLVASFYNCGLFHSAAGHYEYSLGAAVAFGFALPAARLLAHATQDVDAYEWYSSAAHAQAPNGLDGRLTSTASAAFQKFVRWEQCQVSRVQAACSKPVEDRLYLVGYALHGVQDVVFHRGMSNAQHSYLDHMEDARLDCWSRELDRLAKEISGAFLTRLVATLPEDCRNELLDPALDVDGDQLSRVRAAHAGHWDAPGQEDRVGLWLPEYFAAGVAVERLKKAGDAPHRFLLQTPWFAPKTAKRDTRRILDAVFGPTSDVCGDIYDR